MKLKRVLIMAGGTGGHVFPGLSLANYLREQQVDVHWLGTPQGLETTLVPEAQFPLHKITISGLRGKSIKTLLTAPITITRAIWQAVKVIRNLQPDVVVGLGGFVSGPGGVASWLCRKPLVIHEQNAKAGLTNEILSKIARFVLEGFPHSFKVQKKITTIGNPVRETLLDLPPPTIRLANRDRSLRLLVIGGSLGAHFFNQLLPQTLQSLNNKVSIQIVHQTGEKHLPLATKAYQDAHLAYETPDANTDFLAADTTKIQLVPFIKSMAHAYAWADVILCRAGALTVAELCAVGLGAIFVPYPYAVDDHQTLNANFLVSHKAALCFQQKTMTAAQLAALLVDLASHPEKRLQMANAAYGLRNANVTEAFFNFLKQAVGDHKP